MMSFDNHTRFNERMKRYILILFFSIGVCQVMAQEQTPKVDKKTVARMLDWVSIFTMYSDVELSDRVDLKEYGEVADIVGAMITNPELSMKISEFKSATFVNVYPKGIMVGEEWIFRKLNQVSNAQYEALNAPYITLDVVFTPINEFTAYQVSVILRGSPEITQNLQAITQQINAELTGLTFTKPRESKERVNQAIFNGLVQLQTLLGSTYVPNIAIRYDDDIYLNNNTIETWQRTGEGIQLQAVDRNSIPLTGSIVWTNAQGEGNIGTVVLDQVGTIAVTVKAGANQMSLSVKVKEFSFNIEDILKDLLMEVITEKINQARADLERARTDSAGVASSLTEAQQQLDVQSGVAGAAQYSGNTDIKQEIIDDVREGTSAELEEIRRDPIKLNFIDLNRQKLILLAQALLQIKIEVFLNDIIRNDGNVDAYVRAIKDGSPQLLTELVLNMTRKPENRTQIKDIIVNFLNAQIDEVVSRSEG